MKWKAVLTCSTFSSQWTSTWAWQRGRRSISASGSSFPYLFTRQWYLRKRRWGHVVSLYYTCMGVCFMFEFLECSRVEEAQTCKAAPPQGSLSSSGWRTSLRLLSHCHSQRCHLTLKLREAWGEAHTHDAARLWVFVAVCGSMLSTYVYSSGDWHGLLIRVVSQCQALLSVRRNHYNLCNSYEGVHLFLMPLMGLTVLSWGCGALRWCRSAVRECPAVEPPPAWGRSSVSLCPPIG